MLACYTLASDLHPCSRAQCFPTFYIATVKLRFDHTSTSQLVGHWSSKVLFHSTPRLVLVQLESAAIKPNRITPTRLLSYTNRDASLRSLNTSNVRSILDSCYEVLRSRLVLRTTNNMTEIALNRTSDEPGRISFKLISTFSEPLALSSGHRSAVRLSGRDVHEVGLL